MAHRQRAVTWEHSRDHFPLHSRDHAANSPVEYHRKTWKVFHEEQVHYQKPNRTVSVALAPKPGDQRLENHHRQHPVRRKLVMPASAQDLKKSA